MIKLRPHKRHCYVFQNPGIVLAADREALCTCFKDFGSQKKYEQARTVRNARKAKYVHSPMRPRSTGYRYLTPAEMDQWYSQLDQCLKAR